MIKLDGGFDLHVLDPEDYRKLPYPGADDSFGMTIMDKKKAYVMRTGWDEFDTATINHEFEEMMQKTSDHEVNGIRYKGGGRLIRDIFVSAVSVFNPAIGLTLMAGFSASDRRQAKKKANSFRQTQIAKQKEQLQAFRKQQSEATSAFSPNAQLKANSPKPLSTIDFNKSLSRLDTNARQQEQDVFSRFRGLGRPEQNTAFQGALKSSREGSAKARSQFIADQEELKRIDNLVV